MIASKPFACFFLFLNLISLTAPTHAFQPHYQSFWLHNTENLTPPHESHGSHFIWEALPEPVSWETASASRLIPKLHIPGKPEWQQLNDNTWRAFFNNLRSSSTAPEMAAFVSPRVSTQFSRNEFFWDQAFISLGFGLYGHREFNTLGGLDCFYNQQHPDGYIPREISPDGSDSQFFQGQSFMLYVTEPPVKNDHGQEIYALDLQQDSEFFRDQPDKWTQYQIFEEPLLAQRDAIIRMYGSENNSNPPLAAHAEWRHYLLSRDRQRLARVYPVLEAHTRWLENKRQLQQGPLAGLFWQRPMGSGMDNLPVTWIVEAHGTLYSVDLWGRYLQHNITRLTDESFFRQTEQHKFFASFDLSAQMKLHYDAMADISRVFNDEDAADTFDRKANQLKKRINQCLWDEDQGFYHNAYSECHHKSSQYTLSAFWALYANIASTDQARKMLPFLKDERYFAAPMPFPALARSDPDYYEHGNYWQGGVWPPLVYITVKGLMNYASELPKARDIAVEASSAYLNRLAKNMQDTADHCSESHDECLVDEDPVPNWQRIYEYNSPKDGGPGQRKDVDANDPAKFAKPNFVGWGGLGPIGLMLEVALGIEVHETEIVWHQHLEEEYAIENLLIGNGSIDFRVNSSGEASIENTRSLPLSLTRVRVIPRAPEKPEFIIPIPD